MSNDGLDTVDDGYALGESLSNDENDYDFDLAETSVNSEGERQSWHPHSLSQHLPLHSQAAEIETGSSQGQPSKGNSLSSGGRKSTRTRFDGALIKNYGIYEHDDEIKQRHEGECACEHDEIEKDSITVENTDETTLDDSETIGDTDHNEQVDLEAVADTEADERLPSRIRRQNEERHQNRIRDRTCIESEGDDVDGYSDIDSNETYSNASTDRIAILLLDFQNEFVKRGGRLHDAVAESMEQTGLIEKIQNLVECGRATDVLIIYSPIVIEENSEFDEAASIGAFIGEDGFRIDSFFHDDYSKQYGLFTENTWNCEIIYELEPMSDDIVLRNRTDYSAFAGTHLQSILTMNHVDHLFITGFVTDVCVEQTSKDAVRLIPDMSTYVVADCCIGRTTKDHQAALRRIADNSITVVSCAEAEAAIEKYAESNKNHGLDGKDTWLMVDKIFNAADVGENEKMSLDDLQHLIESLPSKTTLPILSIVSDHIEYGNDKAVSRESMHKILFERKKRTDFASKACIFIVMYLLPILYSTNTRLPFIFLALEITSRMGELWEVAAILGAYQTSRAVANLIIGCFGGKDPFRRLEFWLVASGLLGWLFLALYQPVNTDMAQTYANETLVLKSDISVTFEDSGEELPKSVWPLYAVVFIGLGETIVNLQRSIIMETAKESPSGIFDEDVVTARLSVQYSMIACGAVIAFVGGGYMYTYFGFTAVCYFGVAIQITQLIGALTFLYLRRNKKTIRDEELDGNDVIRSVIYQFQTASVIAKFVHDIANGTESTFSSDAVTLANAAIEAKNDRILTHSIREMYRCFFTKERNEIESMEELLESVDKIGYASDTDSESFSVIRRPLGIGKSKLSKLILFLMKPKGKNSLTEKVFINYWAPRVYLSLHQWSQEATVSVVWPYIKYVVITQGIVGLLIGTFLSTALLSYTERFGIDAAQVGTLLGIGEGIGMITILSKNFIPARRVLASFGTGFLQTIISSPLNLPFVLLLASSSCALFAVDNFAVAVLAQMIFSGLNDLSVALMNELVGTSLPSGKFRYYQGVGQWLRRLGNMITAIFGPLLFGVFEGLPFLLFGTFVFTWVLFLWVMLYVHARKMQLSAIAHSVDDDGETRNSFCGNPFGPFKETSITPWYNLEQQYYTTNKDRLIEELKHRKKEHVDGSLVVCMEQRLRSITAALEIEKDKRRLLEDRLYARMSNYDDSTSAASTSWQKRVSSFCYLNEA